MIRYGKCDCYGDVMLDLNSGECRCDSCGLTWHKRKEDVDRTVADALILPTTKVDGVTKFELTREEYEECVNYMKDLGEYGKALEEAKRKYFNLGNSAVKSDSICLKSPAEALNLVPENVRMFTEICSGMPVLYEKKNHDYGNSFHKSWLEEGAAAARLRIGDKFNRFKNLSRGEAQMVEGETMEDTLIDMACYCIMTVIEYRLEAANNEMR